MDPAAIRLRSRRGWATPWAGHGAGPVDHRRQVAGGRACVGARTHAPECDKPPRPRPSDWPRWSGVFRDWRAGLRRRPRRAFRPPVGVLVPPTSGRATGRVGRRGQSRMFSARPAVRRATSGHVGRLGLVGPKSGQIFGRSPDPLIEAAGPLVGVLRVAPELERLAVLAADLGGRGRDLVRLEQDPDRVVDVLEGPAEPG